MEIKIEQENLSITLNKTKLNFQLNKDYNFYLFKFNFCMKNTELYLRIKLPLFNFKIKLTDIVIFYWQDIFNDYINKNNIETKLEILKQNLDEISIDYINKFIELIHHWNHPYNNMWTDEDKKINKTYNKYKKIFKQPFPNILTINPYIYHNKYGLKDLPQNILDKINGNIIIDGGGFNGDTAVMFHEIFPDSEINIFEPLSVNINKINEIIKTGNFNDKIIPIHKGLSDKTQKTEITFNDTEIVDLIPIDQYYNQSSKKIGLIKLDTEGYETLIINGALDTIKKDKPVLAIAIYHTPEDFFELKSKIEALNLGYKFMIRRSEAILPQADLVLICYAEK